ncbi:MAG: HAD hydrolase-like protein [Clostridiales bacterium]|nr:HAD hydrolase-like protein [Clostridiales bacterium]
MENIKSFSHFEKKHDYIICIDSDGTVMDAMNVKHKKCFGPCFVEVFGLEDKKDEVLAAWNQVNLHGETRARNRFITVLIMLKKYNADLRFDLSAFEKWESETDMLTNGSLEKEIEKTCDEVLSRVLHWSLRCNEEISKLTFDDKKPFAGAKEFFAAACGDVDLAVVSSSNIKALMEEWTHFGLYDYMTLLTSQEDGTKIECIEKIAGYGYARDHIIMMGDAVVDLETAQKCGVYFYPVIPEKEAQSWRELSEKYCKLFTSGAFGSCQNGLVEKFRRT